VGGGGACKNLGLPSSRSPVSIYSKLAAGQRIFAIAPERTCGLSRDASHASHASLVAGAVTSRETDAQ
jgi:hypothetical protein